MCDNNHETKHLLAVGRSAALDERRAAATERDSNNQPLARPLQLGDRVGAFIDAQLRKGTIISFYPEWKGETNVPRVRFDVDPLGVTLEMVVSAQWLTLIPDRVSLGVGDALNKDMGGIVARMVPEAYATNLPRKHDPTRIPRDAIDAVSDAAFDLDEARGPEQRAAAQKQFDKAMLDWDTMNEGAE